MISDNNVIGFLKAGKYRMKVLSVISNSLAVPSEIAKQLGVNPSQVSRTLSELETSGLITCTTPDRKIGRIYRITEKGVSVLFMLEAK